jgi:hypothetical protein
MTACPCTALFLKRGGAGVTVSEAVLITPPYVAEMVTVVEAATAPFLPTMPCIFPSALRLGDAIHNSP